VGSQKLGTCATRTRQGSSLERKDSPLLHHSSPYLSLKGKSRSILAARLGSICPCLILKSGTRLAAIRLPLKGQSRLKRVEGQRWSGNLAQTPAFGGWGMNLSCFISALHLCSRSHAQMQVLQLVLNQGCPLIIPCRIVRGRVRVGGLRSFFSSWAEAVRTDARHHLSPKIKKKNTKTKVRRRQTQRGGKYPSLGVRLRS